VYKGILKTEGGGVIDVAAKTLKVLIVELIDFKIDFKIMSILVMYNNSLYYPTCLTG
jgi:hypothetical protein